MSDLYGRIIRRLIWTTAVKRCRQCPTSPGVEPPEHEGGYKLYKRLGLLLGLPIVLGLTAMIHLKKKACEEEREPFHKYPYLRLRSKSFPWGDGQKTMFHNPKTNPLPDGYEDEVVRDENCEE